MAKLVKGTTAPSQPIAQYAPPTIRLPSSTSAQGASARPSISLPTSTIPASLLLHVGRDDTKTYI
eukprot:7785210-Pyramimonas_sp.AAC.1